MAYTCHLCDGAEQAAMLVTPLAGGDTMAVGADCMLTALCGLLSVHAQVDTERLYDAVLGLQGQAEADARADAETEQPCHAMQQQAQGHAVLCARTAGHKGNHKDAHGHQWRSARVAPPEVPESQPAAT
jgi:hypothetical protein